MVSAYEGKASVQCSPMFEHQRMRLGARRAVSAKCKARTGNGGWRGCGWPPWAVCCDLRTENRRIKRAQDEAGK